MIPKVAIFRFELGHSSEAFIPEQAAGLTRYAPEFWGRELRGRPWGNWRHNVADRFGLRAAKLFSLYPNQLFFSNRQFLRESKLIHAHFGPDATYALSLTKNLDIPLISTYHGYDVLTDRTQLAQLGGARIKHYFRHEAELKARGAKFIAVSEYVKRALLRHGYPEERIIQHYMGVDTDRFTPLAGTPDSSLDPFLLSVARHVEFKGIPTLLKAFAEFARNNKDVQLIQIGSGPLLERHKLLATELGIAERVDFKGAVPHETVRSLMQQTLAFCGPSQTASNGGGEALGIVFCEASASGVPVLTTRHGGIPEVVLDGETGFLVNEGDAPALADAMSLVVRNRSLGNQLGQAGRARMVEKFDVKSQSALLEDIYDSIRNY